MVKQTQVDKHEKKNLVEEDKKYIVALVLDEQDLEQMKFELEILQATAHFYPENHIRDQLLAGVIIAAVEDRKIIKLRGVKKK